jgi:flagellar L-ring protein FlgH
MTYQQKSIGSRMQLVWCVIACLGLGACQSTALRPDPAYAASRPSSVPMPAIQQGAIYRVGWDMRLFEDQRPRRVGDLLTIQLTEATDASKSVSSSTSKSSSLSMTNPTLLGSTPLFSLPRFAPLANTLENTLELNQSTERDFDGEGDSQQSNSLSGLITVTIAEVLPNGHFVIRGEKLINLSQGQEHVRISGVVRPQDISGDNVVESTRIANVGISYGGEGAIADSSSMGWLTRFFSSAIMPF